MSLMKKLKLYDGEDVEGFKSKDLKELQEEQVREGMDGISPRYIINRLSSALVREGVTCINPIDALRALRDGLEQHTSINREQREHYLNLIAEARKEYDEMAKKEVQRAFVYSFEESARTLLNNYLDNVEAYCNKQKLRDPITDEEVEPDEELMRSIEEQIGVSENAKKAFREEILIRISSLARRGQQFDYTSARAAEGSDREEAVRRPARRGQDHDLDQDARPGAVAQDQRGGRPAGRASTATARSAPTSCCSTWAACSTGNGAMFTTKDTKRTKSTTRATSCASCSPW